MLNELLKEANGDVSNHNVSSNDTAEVIEIPKLELNLVHNVANIRPYVVDVISEADYLKKLSFNDDI